MVALGSLFIGLMCLALWLRWRGTLFQKRWLMWVFVFAVFGPYLANQAGWVATETGRQPFVVYPEVTWDGDRPHMVHDGARSGLRTRAGLSNANVVNAGHVLGSILMFSIVYLLLFAVWVYVLNSKIQHGPDEDPSQPEGTSARGLLEAAARLNPASGYSLTQAAGAKERGES
jgi:cytochrome d ubiquinol oxidase subunit I